MVLVATCSVRYRAAKSAIVGALFSAALAAAGSPPAAMAWRQAGSLFARLLRRQSAVATYRNTLGRGTAPASPILQDVNSVAGGGNLEAKALQIGVPQELIGFAGTAGIDGPFGDLAAYRSLPQRFQQSRSNHQ